MKKFLFSVVLTGAFGIMQAAPYAIDASHSSVNFKIGHMVVSSVDGNFNTFDGSVDIDSKSKTLKSIEGSIDVASINTRSEKRDAHLKAAEYFDAEKFPKGTLKSVKITKGKSGLKVEADLTLKGITKRVVLNGDLKGPATNPHTQKEVYGLTLQGEINRKDFNIAKDTSSATMGEQVEISISLELNAQ